MRDITKLNKTIVSLYKDWTFDEIVSQLKALRPPKSHPDLSLERRKRAFEMRNKGKTFREIGDALNISPKRAADLVDDYRWYQNRISGVYSYEFDSLDLSVATRNLLANQGIRTIAECVAISNDKPTHLKNLGIKRLTELRKALVSHGHINTESG